MMEAHIPTNVAVIDDDESICSLVENHLLKIGTKNVDTYFDGSKAWSGIEKSDYDLILLDWRLPDVSGLAIFNRLRNLEKYRNVPVLVVSGFLDQKDFKLLDEFPCTSLLEKPFSIVKLDNQMAQLDEEVGWHFKNSDLISSMSESINDNPKKAFLSVKKLLKSAPNPVALGLIAAQGFVNLGHHSEAESLLTKLIDDDDENVCAMNGLAKIYLRQKRYGNATDVLRRAHSISPSNISRICLLGEVELNTMSPDSAQKYFKQALKIDIEDTTAKSGMIVSENMNKMVDSPNPIKLGQSLASILNSIGIDLVKKGKYDKAIEQYQSAMPFLHSKVDTARLAFNLGLGYLRWGKHEKSLQWFEQSSEIGGDKFSRSNKFIKTLKQAMPNKASLRDLENNIKFNSPEAKSLANVPDSVEFDNANDLIEGQDFKDYNSNLDSVTEENIEESEDIKKGKMEEVETESTEVEMDSENDPDDIF